jgi:Winged helix-turn helix
MSDDYGSDRAPAMEPKQECAGDATDCCRKRTGQDAPNTPTRSVEFNASDDSTQEDFSGPPDPNAASGAPGLPRMSRRGKPGRRFVAHQDFRTAPLTAEQRLLLLDTWQRSKLPAGDFAALVGLSKHSLYAWKKRFDAEGPAGLMDQPRGARRGSRLPDLTHPGLPKHRERPSPARPELGEIRRSPPVPGLQSPARGGLLPGSVPSPSIFPGAARCADAPRARWRRYALSSRRAKPGCQEFPIP